MSLHRKTKIFLIFYFLSYFFYFCSQVISAQIENIPPKKEEAPAAPTAANPSESVELNADTIEYSIVENKMIAQGNVISFIKEIRLPVTESIFIGIPK